METKFISFLDKATKILIALPILALLALALYHGIIQGGFSSASWGL